MLRRCLCALVLRGCVADYPGPHVSFEAQEEGSRAGGGGSGGTRAWPALPRPQNTGIREYGKYGPKCAKYTTATAKKNRAFRSVFDSKKNMEKTFLTPPEWNFFFFREVNPGSEMASQNGQI